MPDDPAFLTALAADWTKPLPGTTQPLRIDEGAAYRIGHFLASEFSPGDWRREVTALIPRIRAVLQHTGVVEIEAHKRAASIAVQAENEAQEALDAKAERSEVAKRAARTVTPRRDQPDTAKPEHISTVLTRALAAVDEAPRVLPTPFPTLNWLLNGGFWPAEYVILGARPSVGKSALSTQFALALAQKAHGTLIVSREMRSEAVARRLIAQDGKLDAAALRAGHGGELAKAAQTAAHIHPMPIWLTDRAISPEAVAMMLDDLHGKVELCVIDYLQLMQAPRHIREHRLQVEAVSKALKHIAVSRGVNVLALSSLSRPAAGQERRPTLASLRDSGALEHDADVVLLLHRERDGTETECLLAKNRDGRVGTVQLEFRPQWVGFDEVTNIEFGDGPDADERYGS